VNVGNFGNEEGQLDLSESGYTLNQRIIQSQFLLHISCKQVGRQMQNLQDGPIPALCRSLQLWL